MPARTSRTKPAVADAAEIAERAAAEAASRRRREVTGSR
jgi:hypothetical protein